MTVSLTSIKRYPRHLSVWEGRGIQWPRPRQFLKDLLHEQRPSDIESAIRSDFSGGCGIQGRYGWLSWRLGMRRGRFFRLWLFLSVIWVAASVYIQELRTSQFWRAPILEFQAPSGQKFSINTSKNQNEIEAELNAALGRESRLSSSEVEKTRAAILGVIDTAKQIKSEEARRAWLAAFFPPLAVLGLGLCLGWIFRGFRKKKSNTG